MKRHSLALLLLVCAGCTPSVTKVNVADIAKSDALQVQDRRPASEKEDKIFSLLVTSKQYGVIRTGDNRLSPSPIRLLQHEAYQKFAGSGEQHNVTVYHLVIYQNMRSQLRAGAIGAGVGGMLGGVIGNAMATHDAASQTQVVDEMSFNSVTDEYLRGQYSAAENPSNASVYVIYLDTDIDGKKVFTRTVASMKPHDDGKPLLEAVELAVKNHLSHYDGTSVAGNTMAAPLSTAAVTSAAATTAPPATSMSAQAQGVANQLGCSAVRPQGDHDFVASCGSYDVAIECDDGKCRPVHTIEAKANHG